MKKIREKCTYESKLILRDDFEQKYPQARMQLNLEINNYCS